MPTEIYDAEEKLKALAELPFPANLKQLEPYIGLMGWMGRYCPGYAAIAKPLESRKIPVISRANNYSDLLSLTSHGSKFHPESIISWLIRHPTDQTLW